MTNTVTSTLRQHLDSPDTNARMLEAYERTCRALKEYETCKAELMEKTMRHVRAVLGDSPEGDMVVERAGDYPRPYRFVVKASKIFSGGDIYLTGPLVRKDGTLSPTVSQSAWLSDVVLSDRSDRT